MTTGLEILLVEREITRQQARLVRLIDQRRWDALADIFAEDVCFDYAEGEMRRSLPALRRVLNDYLGNCGPTQHCTSDLIIDVADEHHATSRAYVRARHQGSGDFAPLIFDGYGEYLDSWEKRPEGWRIVQRQARLLLAHGDFKAMGSPRQAKLEIDPAVLNQPGG